MSKPKQAPILEHIAHLSQKQTVVIQPKSYPKLGYYAPQFGYISQTKLKSSRISDIIKEVDESLIKSLRSDLLKLHYSEDKINFSLLVIHPFISNLTVSVLNGGDKFINEKDFHGFKSVYNTCFYAAKKIVDRIASIEDGVPIVSLDFREPHSPTFEFSREAKAESTTFAPLSPPIPTEKYVGNRGGSKDGENVIGFIRRVWLPWVQAGGVLTRPVLKAHDFGAWQGLTNFLRTENLPDDLWMLDKKTAKAKLASDPKAQEDLRRARRDARRLERSMGLAR